ncbi:MAG: polyhydroxyalkanoate synthesis regulator DNA-binding domain-containing protein [Leptospiraceae bacterium]|nr:polyhydroxyalkanoate synthesis regulator DNA-binding domain-containing protein [Leptospiraceae bacterium]MDW8307165.1 polyhydroxyalkanoate synthesis regulator DNA-binding domain-containing protein [Leptospiraceae bacterium]
MKVIKRYANRRLYDAETSRTITLEEVAQFVRRGEDIKVIDNITGEDITTKILGQAFLKIQEPIPQESQNLLNYLLKALIRESQGGFFTLVRKLLLAGIGLAGMPRSERDALLKMLLSWDRSRDSSGEIKESWLNDLASRGQRETDKLAEAVVKSLQAIQAHALQVIESLDSKGQFEELARTLETIRESIIPRVEKMSDKQEFEKTKALEKKERKTSPN